MRLARGRHRAVGESGGVAVVVAISLVAMITMIGLAIDGGILFNERRYDQNVADHAALAAAWAYCNGDDPVSAGLASARDNGSTNDGVNSTVSISQSGPNTFEAVVGSSRGSAFVGVVGIETLSATAEATAECVLISSSGYAAFAMANNCAKAIDWSGSTTEITGRVHSNTGIHVGGQTNIVNGQVTYLTDIEAAPDKITFVPPIGNPTQLGATLPYPVTFAISDYAPGGSRAALATSQGRYHNAGNAKIDMGWLTLNGKWNDLTKTLAPGLYYTTNDIDLSASLINGLGVTFVAGGVISLSGSGHNLTPWDPDDLLVFSNYMKSSPIGNQNNCVASGVNMSGSTHRWVGTVYAPRSQIQMSGSTNTTFAGSLIGWTVKLNGSLLFIESNSSGPLVPHVRILA